ncbi:hypothetical protein IAR50_006633 [Cryptococcus sp. DSM 104548]
MLSLRQTLAGRRALSHSARLNHRFIARSSPALLSEQSSFPLQPRLPTRTYVSFTRPSPFFSSPKHAASGELGELESRDKAVLDRLRAGEGQLVDEGYYDPDDKFNDPPVSYDPFRYPSQRQPPLPLDQLKSPSGRQYTSNTAANILCRHYATTKQLCRETTHGEIFSIETFVIVYESGEGDLVQSLEKGKTFRGRVIFANDRITHLAFDGHVFSVSHDPNGVHGTTRLTGVVGELAETEREMLGIDPKTAGDILALHVEERRDGTVQDSTPAPFTSSEPSHDTDTDRVALLQHLESLANERKQALTESRAVLERVRGSMEHLVVDYDEDEGTQILGVDDFNYPAQVHSLPLQIIKTPSGYEYTNNTAARILSPDDSEPYELCERSKDGKVVTYDGIIRVFEQEEGNTDLVSQMDRGKTLRARIVFADGRITHLAVDGHVFSLAQYGEILSETVHFERVVGILGKEEREMIKIEPTLFESIYTQHVAEYEERKAKDERRNRLDDPIMNDELNIPSVPNVAEWNLDPRTLVGKLPIWVACGIESHPEVFSSPASVINTEEVVERINAGEELEFFVEKSTSEWGWPSLLHKEGKGRWYEWIVRVRERKTADGRDAAHAQGEVRIFVATIHDDGLRAKTISIGGTLVNLELQDGGGYTVGEEDVASEGLAGL